jgi:N6-L-threonylcarbamoyladenine synthase
MITLGIETSCDETALALIETRGSGADFECRVIASLIHSQAELHSAYGGVFPTLAKREHGRNIVPLMAKLLSEAEAESFALQGKSDNKSGHFFRDAYKDIPAQAFEQKMQELAAEMESKDPDLFAAIRAATFLHKIPPIDRIAVTEGPGLEPTLWVGIGFARTLSKLWNLPIVPVNHMEGHVVASLLKSDAAHGEWQKLSELPSPAIALLISGGHTELIKITALGQYELIGQTKDDAVGEAFDKVARLLGLPYPGGPHLSKLSHEAAEENIVSPVKLPRPMIGSGDFNFSFSGLKTAVLYATREATKDGKPLGDSFKRGLAREFENAVTETLEKKLSGSIESIGAQSVIIGGGVSANRMLRSSFERLGKEYDIPVYLPSTHTSGDNALMIALAGALQTTIADRQLKADGTKSLAHN